MKRFYYICVFLMFSLWSFSQDDEITIVTKDSIKTIINPLAPAKAAFYSAVVPGLGQAYNKKYWKIPIVYAGLGIGIYAYTWNQKQYNGFRSEYKKRLDGTSLYSEDPLYGRLDNTRVLNGQKFHQRNRDLAALITAGIYIFNIIDANVDAHLLQFNVNDNLSIRPEINQNQTDFNYNSGLRLTYNF